jgi:hypothetical protein
VALTIRCGATIVDRDGVVCAVAFSGVNRGAQWPGSRVISAQKANTANAFGLDSSSFSGGSGQPNGLALSTANLYYAVQPGGSLYGLRHSNPVEAQEAYDGPSRQVGSTQDPMVGTKIGGINVFGGGLALYGPGKVIMGWGVLIVAHQARLPCLAKRGSPNQIRTHPATTPADESACSTTITTPHSPYLCEGQPPNAICEMPAHQSQDSHHASKPISPCAWAQSRRCTIPGAIFRNSQKTPPAPV